MDPSVEVLYGKFVAATDWCVEVQYWTILTHAERQYQDHIVCWAGVELPYASLRKVTEGRAVRGEETPPW